MQSVHEIEQLDLWKEFFRSEHKTKIERLDLDRFSPQERNIVTQAASEIENFKLEFDINYLSHRVLKSLIQIEIQ